MIFINFFLLIFSLCFLPSLAFSGTSHYVDCSAAANGNGSYASPWNNITSVNSHSFSTGDDVYFKVNTTCTPSTYLAVDWSGTSGDRVIIGAYYGNGKFGLNGKTRPIIDGNNNTVPSSSVYRGLIDIAKPSVSNVTVENLRLQYSGKYGVGVGSSDNINVDNCYLYRNKGAGIIYGKSYGNGTTTGVISNNTVENSGYPDYSSSGAAIEVTGGETENATYGITVTGNKVFASKHEGIGLYKKVKDSIVEYNTVHDVRSYHIYIASSLNNIVRYNMVYNYAGKFGRATAHGISAGQERQRTYCYGGGTQIYGNLVSSQSIGISLGCGVQRVPGLEDCVCHDNTVIYNNTLVDNNTNFMYWRPTAGDSITIKNNISWVKTSGTKHLGSGTNTNTGVTWGYNNFYTTGSGGAVPGAPAATDAVIGNPNLEKSSGWHSLSAGILDGTEFNLLSGSKAINTGISIVSYNNRITASDYSADPIMVMKSTDSTPDIGAWSNEAAVGVVDPPSDLVITGSQ